MITQIIPTIREGTRVTILKTAVQMVQVLGNLTGLLSKIAPKIMNSISNSVDVQNKWIKTPHPI